MEGLHTQYQQELDQIIEALKSHAETLESVELDASTLHRMVGVAEQLIVRDDLDELVSVAQKLFPDGYMQLREELDQARHGLDNWGPRASETGADISREESVQYAINKLDNARDMLKSDAEIEESWHQYNDDSALDED